MKEINDCYDNDFIPSMPKYGSIAILIAYLVAIILAGIGIGFVVLIFKLISHG